MATIVSGLQLTMHNNRYGITSETTATDEVRATPAPTTTRITNSIENGSILVVYDGSFNPDLFDPTFQDNTAGIFGITGYQEYLATDTNNDNGLRITGWAGETFDSIASPNFDTLYGGDDSISGSASNDLIHGYLGADTLLGNDGNDTVVAGRDTSDELDSMDGGDDVLYGGRGADSIYGAAGDDVMYGGRAIADADDGSDMIFGYIGSDTIFGNTGDDTIYGEWNDDSADLFTGHDRIYGGRGSDVIYGQGGNDILAGGGGLAHPDDEADTISGGAGNDTIVGNGGNDRITGDGGNDSLFGGRGLDQLDGGEGNDVLVGQIGNDTLTGGAGNDTFHFSALDEDDQVTDFDAGTAGTAVDILHIDPNLGVSTFAELLTKSAVIEGHTVLAFDDGTSILLLNVTSLGEEDVVFGASNPFFADVVAIGF